MSENDTGARDLLRPTLCCALVEAAATTLRDRAERKGVALRVERPEDDLVLRVDRRALSQIVLEMIESAIENAGSGEIRVRVARHQRNGRRGVEVSVSGLDGAEAPADAFRLVIPER